MGLRTVNAASEMRKESDVFGDGIVYPKPSRPAAQRGRNTIQMSSRLLADPVGQLKCYLFLADLQALPPFHTIVFSPEPHGSCFWDLQGVLFTS